MRYINIFLIVFILLMAGGCASLDCKPSGNTLQGTDTAMVGIYIDKNGYPQADVDVVKVYPGQRVLFAGPDKFDIVFKDPRTLIDKQEVASSNGIVVIDIPRDIFERAQRESKTTDIKQALIYRYGIRANGKLTDPSIHIERR